MTVKEEIRAGLFDLQDEKYRDFQAKLIPGKDTRNMIGVRTPALRKYAKELAKRADIEEFLGDLPHRYFDEDQLHAFIISLTGDYGRCMEQVCGFLPYVDNWATCDQMSPKVFKKYRPRLLPQIREWIGSGETYAVRFGIGRRRWPNSTKRSCLSSSSAGWTRGRTGKRYRKPWRVTGSRRSRRNI